MDYSAVIRRKQKIHDHFSVVMVYRPETRAKSLNEKFLEKVISVVQQHIAENEFSIEEFSREVGISRAQLHRKLKALTGKSASRYIMSFRLLLASEMIRNHEGNISEVAYSVGFSSPIYFSRCFKEEFGFPPSKLLAS